MTPAEITAQEAERLRAIVRIVMKEERESLAGDPFYIPRKEFYDQHQRLKFFLGAIDGTASAVGKIVITLMVLGILALLVWGSGIRK